MSKQILIDYDEYLCLEKCQKVLKDIIEENEHRSSYLHNPSDNSQILELNMPNSLKEVFAEDLKYRNIISVKFKL